MFIGFVREKNVNYIIKFCCLKILNFFFINRIKVEIKKKKYWCSIYINKIKNICMINVFNLLNNILCCNFFIIKM